MPIEDMLIQVDPNDFRTDFDGLHDGTAYPEQQFAAGEKLAKEGYVLTIGQSGTWVASRSERDTIVSYERLGYHACTKDLLRGFLSANGKCLFYHFRGIWGQVTL